MATLTETLHAGGFIISQANGDRSFEQATLISGQNLKVGTVLGKITASGKYTLHDNAAADGSQNAAAILFDDCNASAADKRCVILARDAEVADSMLTFKSGISGGNRTAAIAALAALGIIAR